MGGGCGTNARVELMAVWVLLNFASIHNLVRCRWQGTTKHLLNGCLRELHFLCSILVDARGNLGSYRKKFHDIHFQHIFKVFNSMVDTLSKKALGLEEVILFFLRI